MLTEKKSFLNDGIVFTENTLIITSKFVEKFSLSFQKLGGKESSEQLFQQYRNCR